MPLSPQEVEELQKLEAEAQDRLDPGSDDYDSMVNDLNSIGDLLDTHYKSLRKVDDSGKLTEQPQTRMPAVVGESQDSDYFFEPSVKEVQAFLKRNPGALDRLKSPDGTPLRNWAEGEASPEIRTPHYDAQTQALVGYDVTPAKSHLDMLTDAQPPYGIIADEMWRLAGEDANRLGKSVKRYRDVKLDGNEWKDYIAGGVQKGLRNIIAPAALNATDSMTMGIASPYLDATRDLYEYELGKRGYNTDWLPDKSEDISNRNPTASFLGTVAGYGITGNPTNAIQNLAADAVGYTGKGAVGVARRAGASAVGGAVSNAVESAVGAPARYANEGESIPVGTIGLNALVSGGIGAVAGPAADLLGQATGVARDAYGDFRRQAPLRTLEQAGGEASVLGGVSPPPAVTEAEERVKADWLDETRAPRVAASDLAEQLAPHLEQSVTDRARAEQQKIGDQMRQYYAHPDYNQIKGTTKPAIQGLLDQVSGGFGRDAAGRPVHVDQPTLKRVGALIREYAGTPEVIPSAVAGDEAARSGGILIEPELANQLFPDVLDPVGPNHYVIVQPITVDARALTKMEERIYRELDIATGRNIKDDPVWKTFNEGVKETRDQFPWYEDAEGNLVGIPPASDRSEPFQMDPGAVPPEGEMHVMGPPIPVKGGTPRKPEGVMAVGPGRPDLPSSPFDPRAGSREVNGVVTGERNPFDASLPTSEEAVRPLTTIEVQGEYGPPPPIDPNARMGVGDRFNPEPVQGFTEEGLPIPRGVSKQPTKQVQGTYNKPPEVQMEPAPKTDRNPYGFADRGQPPPEQPLPPSERRRTNKEPEFQVENANDLKKIPGALVVPKPLLKDQLSKLGIEPTLTPGQARERRIAQEIRSARSQGFDSVEDYNEFWEANHATSDNPNRETIEGFIARKRAERGQRIEPRADQDITPEERALQQHDIDEFLRKDQEMNAPKADDRGGLTADEAIKLMPNNGNRQKLEAAASDLRAHGFKVTPENLHAREVIGGADRMGRPDANGNVVGRSALSEMVNPEVVPSLQKEVQGFETKAPDERGGLEKMLDERLGKAPEVSQSEIDRDAAIQTKDREAVAANWKAYSDELSKLGKADQVEQAKKFKAIGDNPEVIDEVIEQVKDIDRRLGDGSLSLEEKRNMVLSALKQRGIDIKLEDLVRFGLISAGVATMSANDTGSDTKEAGFGLGPLLISLGLLGRGKKGGAEPGVEPKPAKPKQPEGKLPDGRTVRGFSAVRGRQHEDQVAIEKAMKAVGVGGNVNMQNRIRTYGQLPDRGDIDQALLDEAHRIGKADKLREAAGANAYATMKDRAWWGASDGWLNKAADFLGLRVYRASEYFAGRHMRDTPAGDDGLYRNPYVREPKTTLGKMQREMVEDPARRLLNLTRGGPAARIAGNELYDALKEHSKYMTVDEYKREQMKKEKLKGRKSASP